MFSSPDHQPLTHVGRFPVYISTVYILLCTAGMLASVILGAAGTRLLTELYFSPHLFWRGHLWQVLTCTWMGPPSFFWLFGIFLLYQYGIEVERYLGRGRYLILTGGLILLPCLVYSLLFLAGGFGVIAGNESLVIGVFVAFATFYPNIEVWNWVKMKWLVAACIFLSLLSDLSSRSYVGITITLAACAWAFLYIQALKSGGWRELLDFLKPSSDGSEGSTFRPASNRTTPRQATLPPTRELAGRGRISEEATIDALLDKISRQGVESLTAEEKSLLNDASQRAQRRQRRAGDA